MAAPGGSPSGSHSGKVPASGGATRRYAKVRIIAGSAGAAQAVGTLGPPFATALSRLESNAINHYRPYAFCETSYHTRSERAEYLIGAVLYIGAPIPNSFFRRSRPVCFWNCCNLIEQIAALAHGHFRLFRGWLSHRPRVCLCLLGACRCCSVGLYESY